MRTWRDKNIQSFLKLVRIAAGNVKVENKYGIGPHFSTPHCFPVNSFQTRTLIISIYIEALQAKNTGTALYVLFAYFSEIRQIYVFM